MPPHEPDGYWRDIPGADGAYQASVMGEALLEKVIEREGHYEQTDNG